MTNLNESDRAVVLRALAELERRRKSNLHKFEAIAGEANLDPSDAQAALDRLGHSDHVWHQVTADYTYSEGPETAPLYGLTQRGREAAADE